MTLAKFCRAPAPWSTRGKKPEFLVAFDGSYKPIGGIFCCAFAGGFYKAGYV